MVTCGVLVTDGERYLICHPTNGKWWDLPKGQKDPGESDAETAIREMHEETGIVATEDKLEHLGVFKYRPKKDLSLFMMRVDTMPDPLLLRCFSKFQNGMHWIAEMDAFLVVDRQTCLDKVSPNMRKVLGQII